MSEFKVASVLPVYQTEFKVGSTLPVYQTESKAKVTPATKLTPTVNKTTNEPVINTNSSYSGRSAVASHNSSANTQVFGSPRPKANPIRTEAKIQATSQNPTAIKSSSNADELIASLPKKNTPAYFKAISKMLSEPEKRAVLIKHFNLDSPANKEAFKVAIFMEGGASNKANAKTTAEIIMNRAITIGISKGSISIAEVVKKPSQFAINNLTTMHKEKLKTFDEVMSSKKGKQYDSAMSPNVDAIATSVIAGNRGETGAIHYGFKGKNGINVTDTPTSVLDRGTVNSWYK